MKSPVIKEAEGQLTLSFEPGISERYACLRECIASGVYRQGLSNVAIDLDKAPGNLSVELSADTSRKFSVDSLETYIEKTGDTAPIYYLIDKFLKEAGKGDEAEVAALLQMFKTAAPTLKKLGIV